MHILITGASSGLGAALAEHYATEGAMLSLIGRNAERLEEVAEACRGKGADVITQQLDVTDADAMSDYLTALDAEKPIDLIIANAGISGGTEGGVAESEEQVRSIFAVNVDGVLNSVLPLVPRFRERGAGQIAIVASVAGYMGLPTAPAYSATKAAVKTWGEALRGNLAKSGVSVSVICPGYIKTPMTDVNNFPMPFMMSAEKAASIIAKGLAKNKGRIAFPWPMVWTLNLVRNIPFTLLSWVLSRLPGKPVI